MSMLQPVVSFIPKALRYLDMLCLGNGYRPLNYCKPTNKYPISILLWVTWPSLEVFIPM